MGTQSQLLAKELRTAVNSTFEAAPERTQGFQLGLPITEAIHDRCRERRLEAAMVRQWNRPGMLPVPGGWGRLVAFQVPLFSEQQKGQWGYVDLLGVNAGGLPVVVELKKDPDAAPDGKTRRSETPLRMVLEAAAYAVALRKNWRRFREEWVDHLAGLGTPGRTLGGIPAQLTTVPLVAAAPASFWIDWLPVTKKGRKVGPETWQSFRSLLAELSRVGLPVTFVSISGNDGDEARLALQPLVGFPPFP